MKNKQIIYEAALAAKKGNKEAVRQLLDIYAPFVLSCSKCTRYDDKGNSYETVDEEIRRRIEAKLAYLFIYDYDLSKPPPTDMWNI